MKTGGLDAFAEQREEIWLWPAAALAYLYTVDGSILLAVGFVASIFTGAVWYNLHRVLRQWVEDRRPKSNVRKRNSRAGVNESVMPDSEALSALYESLFPDRSGIMFALVIAMLLNLLFGTLALVILVLRTGEAVLSGINPSLVSVGLLSLPLLVIASMVTRLAWSA
jgi:uncharacterized membrane protein